MEFVVIESLGDSLIGHILR